MTAITSGTNWSIYKYHADLCKVLTNPKRLRAIELLQKKEYSVNDLAEAIGVSSTNMSQHLTVMRKARIVETRQEGTTVYYSLAYPEIAAACALIHQVAMDQLSTAGELAKSAQERFK